MIIRIKSLWNPAGTRTGLQGVRWRAVYLKPCSRRIQYLTECLKLQFQRFQRPIEDVSKTLIIWRHHKDVLETFNWKILKTLLCRRLQILWLEIKIKTFWRRGVFNLENTFWTSIKHFQLSHLKALWRRFEGSISKRFKHTVQSSSGCITWGRGEDKYFEYGSFFNLKNDLWTC